MVVWAEAGPAGASASQRSVKETDSDRMIGVGMDLWLCPQEDEATSFLHIHVVVAWVARGKDEDTNDFASGSCGRVARDNAVLETLFIGIHGLVLVCLDIG